MKISIGAANFGNKYGLKHKSYSGRKKLNKLIKLLKYNKINTVDTAQAYGDSELIIGKIFPKNTKVITKILTADLKVVNKNHFDFIDKSLKKLDKKKIYACLLHDIDIFKLKNPKKILNKFINLKKKGYVENVGVSVYSPKELNLILHHWRPDLVQLPLNLFDTRFYESGLINKLKKNNIKIVVRSCFLQGSLINDYTKKKQFKNFKKEFYTFFKWCKIHNISRIKACLDFLKNKGVDYAIIGFDNFNQCNEIIKCFKSKKAIIPNIFRSKKNRLIDPRAW